MERAVLVRRDGRGGWEWGSLLTDTIARGASFLFVLYAKFLNLALLCCHPSTAVVLEFIFYPGEEGVWEREGRGADWGMLVAGSYRHAWQGRLRLRVEKGRKKWAKMDL